MISISRCLANCCELSFLCANHELLEEIGYVPHRLELFDEKADGKRRYCYHGELTVPVSELQLNEGQDMALCSVEEIRTGEKYSERLGEVRSLGKPHQQALLTFIENNQTISSFSMG